MTEEEGVAWARERGLIYLEVSAKTAFNVEEVGATSAGLGHRNAQRRRLFEPRKPSSRTLIRTMNHALPTRSFYRLLQKRNHPRPNVAHKSLTIFS